LILNIGPIWEGRVDSINQAQDKGSLMNQRERGNKHWSSIKGGKPLDLLNKQGYCLLKTDSVPWTLV
jgi:hypothetical protein